MAIIGITTGEQDGIVVHYLAEDLWIGKDFIPMVYLNPLIFWTNKVISKISIIIHGKPGDIRRFCLTSKNDKRILDITIKGEVDKNCSAIITSDLLSSPEYLKLEAWDEYEDVMQEDKPTIGLAEKISPILKDDISAIEWVHQDMEECSILEINFSKPLKKFEFYGLRMGILLNYPYRTIHKLKRKMFKGVTYSVHHCTLNGISPKDENIIIRNYLADNMDRFAQIIYNVSQHKSSSCFDTSSLAVYTYRGYLFHNFFEIDHFVDESNTTFACSKRRRTFQPFNLGELDPRWRVVIWTQKDFGFALSSKEYESGNKEDESGNKEDKSKYEIKYLKFNLGEKGHYPINVAINKFDGLKGLSLFAIGIALFPIIYSSLGTTLFNKFIGDHTISFILIKIVFSICIIVSCLLLVNVFFKTETTN